MTSSPKETASGARFFRDAVRFAVASIRAHRTRSLLTALSMVVANASVILVVSTALTGRDFVVKQIQGVGSNLVYAYYEAGGNVSESEADYITLADVEAVRRQLGPRAQAVAGVMGSWDRLFIDGRERQIRVLGSSAEYEAVRNLKIPAGRFFDADDVARRAKVCLLTEPLAGETLRLFASRRRSIDSHPRIALYRDRRFPGRSRNVGADRSRRRLGLDAYQCDRVFPIGGTDRPAVCLGSFGGRG